MVLKGRLGLQRSLALHPKPFANLKKEDLKVEVMAKGSQVDVSAVNAQRFEAERTARANNFCLNVTKEN